VSAREIVPGLFGVAVKVFGIPYVNAFLLTEGELTLIDTGLPKKQSAIERALRDLSMRVEQVRHIVLSHQHVDHVGNADAIGKSAGARVYAHPADAPVIRGDVPRPGVAHPSWLSKLTDWIGDRTGSGTAQPASVDELIEDGQVLPIGGGLRVIHTPGHTPGHVSLLWRRVLIAADAAGGLFGRVGPPLGTYTEDIDVAKQSIRKLAELDFDVACFGHGTPVRGQANVKFRRLVERLAR